MEQNEFRTVTPVRKKVKKITLNAGIALGIICFLLGLLFGGAFSSGKNVDALEKQVAALELSLEELTARNNKLEETYKVKINDLKMEKDELKNQLKNSDAVTADDPKEETASASELKGEEENTPAKSSGGILKKIIIAILVIAVIAIILVAASIFLKKNGHDDDDDEEYYDDDDEYDDEEDDEYEEDDEDDEE